MRRILLFLLLSLAGSLGLQAQITVVNKASASSNNGSTQWSVVVAPLAGDTLVVGCDHTSGVSFTGVTDSVGDTFVPIGTGPLAQDFAAHAYLATRVRGGATTVTCAASSPPPYNEIYVTELKGVDPVHPLDTQVSASGPTTPARASLATTHANELVWAYVQSGHVSNASGWAIFSTFDGNLIADRVPTSAGTVNASFAVTMDWTLILAALNPAVTSDSGSSSPISVSVSPTTASVQMNQSAPFTASVQNDLQNRGVTWRLSGGGCSGASCGTLTNVTSTSVTYTAPGLIPSPATVILTATSVVDTTKSSTATITITSTPPPISVSVSPSSSSVQVSQTANFTATVQNDSQNKGATWSLSGSGCSGASCGTLSNVTTTSVTYTAPSLVPSPASVTLRAAAVADTTKSSAATITVTAAPPPISISISPSSSSVQISQTANFAATLQNDSQNKGATWSLSGSGCSGASCGTLSSVTTSSVTYTAPTSVPNPATVTLTAASVADTSKSATATITVTSPGPALGVPILVQHVSHSNTQTHFVNSYAIRLVFPTGSGNCVFVAVQSSGGSIPTVTDDAGNSYTRVINASDSTNTDLTLFKAPVTHAGSQNLQVGFSNAAEYVAAEASEFMNMDPGCALDGTASTNSGTGSQLTAGNISTAANGDLIYAFGVQDATPDPISSWKAGTAFALLGADVMDSHFTEWQVQSSAGLINPSAAFSTSNGQSNWFMAAMAIKPGTSGTAPNGIHGVHDLHLALPAGQAYPLTVQFPCTTTSGPIVVIGNAEPSNDFTGLADSNGNHWTKRGAATYNYSGLADIWDTDAGLTTCSPSMTVTINKTGTDITGSTLIFIDVSDCGAQPCFDSAPGYASAGGVQTTGTTVASASITPTTATGACFSSMAVDAYSLSGVSPGLFLSSTADPEPADFQDDENNGYAVIYNPGTAGFTLTWQNLGGPAQGWASGITCYKGSANSSATPQ